MKIKELPEETVGIVRRLIENGCIEIVDEEVDITKEIAKVLLILDRAGVFS